MLFVYYQIICINNVCYTDFKAERTFHSPWLISCQLCPLSRSYRNVIFSFCSEMVFPFVVISKSRLSLLISTIRPVKTSCNNVALTSFFGRGYNSIGSPLWCKCGSDSLPQQFWLKLHIMKITFAFRTWT